MADKSQYNERMRIYMAKRYERRRRKAIDQLGGECVHCDSTVDLEFDHIDPSTKSFAIGGRLAGVSEAKLQQELAKCQLLCDDCHISKTRENKEFAPTRYGEACNLAVLTEREVLDIRAKYKPRVYTMKMLSAEYGVTPDNVKQILARNTWKHI